MLSIALGHSERRYCCFRPCDLARPRSLLLLLPTIIIMMKAVVYWVFLVGCGCACFCDDCRVGCVCACTQQTASSGRKRVSASSDDHHSYCGHHRYRWEKGVRELAQAPCLLREDNGQWCLFLLRGLAGVRSIYSAHQSLAKLDDSHPSRHWCWQDT